MDDREKDILIEDLLQQKFPNYSYGDRYKAGSKVNNYKLSLEMLCDEGLEKLYSENHKSESQLFFSKTCSDSDLDYYCKLPVWSQNQVLALLYLKDPQTIVDDLKKVSKSSPLGKQYNQIKTLLNTSTQHKEIAFKIDHKATIDPAKPVRLYKPIDIVKWAMKKEILINNVEILKKLITKYGNNINEDSKAARDELFSLCKKTIEKTTGLIEEVNDLKVQNEKLKDQINSVPEGKRAKSWQKFSIGLLAKCYKLENVISSFASPAKDNNSEIKKITYTKIIDDLNKQGIEIDDETVKKLIDESIKHLLENK